MRILKRLLLSLLLLLLCVVGATYWLATHQGRDAVRWSSFSKAKVQFDANGIPTLEAADWDSLVYAQGFVVASDRLWQMDLMRRAGAGRLAEWFGNIDKVVAFDEERRQEDWLGVADRAVADLPADERATCDAFAGGVNHFIQENTWRWGLEYLFLRTRPEPWQCRDSLLILLSMVEDLSEVFEEEAQSSAWRRFLTPSWEAFLFTSAHPWNTPQFDGAKKEPLVDFPQEKIPLQPLQPEEAANEKFDAEDFVIGSNSWIYRGQKGFFLANDPHLSHSVPQLWYPIRFQKGPQEWAVGVALPGIPALVLGRNAKVAWGFTNVKEDVDDILEEEMSEDGKQYVASVTRGKKEWKPVEERAYEIQIRDTAPRKGTAYFTHRGPVSKRPFMGESFFSRQWLGFQKGALRLPGLALMQATDWESFNQAVDRFAAPAQAVVYANVDRSFGIRVSGRGIRRKRTGLVPQPAIEGEWLGIEGPEKRFRSWVPADSKTAFLSSANQRLWKAGWGEHWSSDVRDQRIREFLGGPSELDRQQMRALQQDTRSRSMRSLLLWLAKHAVPASASQTALLDSWKKWEGFAEVEEATFAQALLARQLFVRALLSRVRKQFLPTSIQEVRYRWKLENAWQVRIWEASEVEPLAAFGLSSAELATWIVGEVEKKALTQYSVTNRWRKQHPFAHSVPVLGKFFQLEELPQKGFSGVVRTEEPLQGASTRLIWDMDAEDGGEWAFPVGQSGHVFSPFYQNFRKAWFAKSYLPARN